jgi:hypothetical protein
MARGYFRDSDVIVFLFMIKIPGSGDGGRQQNRGFVGF